MKPRVVVVVPWRAGDPNRERAWKWCRPWWEQFFGWPIFEVEHPGPAPFNRAAAINEGARRAWPFDVMVVIDADVFEDDPEQVRSAVEKAHETGRLTIPHTTGADLNDRGTSFLVSGRAGWQRLLAKRREVCTSRVWAIRADLFEAVGGFDERFTGWGHEDVAAFHTMRTLRGVEQLPGICWHLWHQPSFHIARRTKEYSEGGQLAERYLIADRQGWPALAPILAERSEMQRWDPPVGKPPERTWTERGTDVIVLTAGRRQYLERTLESFGAHVSGEIGHRTIFDDSADPDFGSWCKRTYPDWEIVTTPGHLGFTKAIRFAWTHETGRGGSPYIFHLEEDFVFEQDVNIDEQMVPILEANRKIAQVALLRGPFFPPEIEAGGIVQEDPDAYEHRDGYLVHSKFFTTNPCLYRRSLLRLGWPAARNSETVFTRLLVRRGYSFAFLGDGTPQVSHIGVERTGRGY